MMSYTTVQSWPFHCCWTQRKRNVRVCHLRIFWTYVLNHIKSYHIESMFRNYLPLSVLKNRHHHFSLPRLSTIWVVHLLVTIITMMLAIHSINKIKFAMKQKSATPKMKRTFRVFCWNVLLVSYLFNVSNESLNFSDFSFEGSKISINGAMCFWCPVVVIIHY